MMAGGKKLEVVKLKFEKAHEWFDIKTPGKLSRYKHFFGSPNLPLYTKLGGPLSVPTHKD